MGISVVWGVAVAYAIQALIEWQSPSAFFRIVFGYALGMYLSIPNFGLVDEKTIPQTELMRHYLLSLVPAAAYAIALVWLRA